MSMSTKEVVDYAAQHSIVCMLANPASDPTIYNNILLRKAITDINYGAVQYLVRDPRVIKSNPDPIKYVMKTLNSCNAEKLIKYIISLGIKPTIDNVIDAINKNLSDIVILLLSTNDVKLIDVGFGRIKSSNEILNKLDEYGKAHIEVEDVKLSALVTYAASVNVSVAVRLLEHPYIKHPTLTLSNREYVLLCQIAKKNNDIDMIRLLSLDGSKSRISMRIRNQMEHDNLINQCKFYLPIIVSLIFIFRWLLSWWQ